MKPDLVIGLIAVAIMWAFLFWCVFWTCTSDMGSIGKCLIVILCVFAFFSIRLKHVDDGKNEISIGCSTHKDTKK